MNTRTLDTYIYDLTRLPKYMHKNAQLINHGIGHLIAHLIGLGMVYARFYESAYAVITSVYAATRTCYTTPRHRFERIGTGKCRSLLTGNIGARRTYKEKVLCKLTIMGSLCNLGV